MSRLSSDNSRARDIGDGGHMTTPKRRLGTVVLTDEHFRKMIDDHVLEEDEIHDQAKVSRVLQKLVDSGLGLPETPWHEWDDWEKGLE